MKPHLIPSRRKITDPTYARSKKASLTMSAFLFLKFDEGFNLFGFGVNSLKICLLLARMRIIFYVQCNKVFIVFLRGIRPEAKKLFLFYAVRTSVYAGNYNSLIFITARSKRTADINDSYPIRG